MNYSFRKTTKDDWNQIKSIYKAGIATGNATFESQAPPSYEKWLSKAHLECTLVLHEGNTILGWCKLSPVSDRTVYVGVGEVSIYVHPNSKGKGIGNLLLQLLIKASEEHGFWTLQASIFPENIASIHLHQKNGFREVGIRERIGKIDGVWRDNVFLERRSVLVGMN
ncbi:N-acetyltransferase family protein [Psychrobacillus sp. FSL H8-0483]|uniref:GNAT family N-acetyltransferase n=1 Tax=Psychrobacillus sp. FSL H8-0483 TaxID=2921389 RepID=UPI00315A1612